ncbi:hypothetical protein V1283_007397 [Bradyrhizobium sp. AZCC 2262]|uniref:hypothetical protein n=1 Tax=Bradyrhizobium sp. AZCC 2262 TaxID=3117022 RepID=UPI002FF3BC13
MFAISSFDSHQSTAALGEISAILAVGLQRLLQRKSSQFSPEKSETPLDCRAVSSGHIHPKDQGIAP